MRVKPVSVGLLKSNMDTIGIFFFMLIVFSFIIFQIEFNSDFMSHINMAKVKLEENKLFADYFMFYLLLNLFSGFSGKLLLLKIALVLLLSVANTFKYCLAKSAFEGIVDGLRAKMASASLLVVFVIPWLYFAKVMGYFCNSQFYMGYYVPNVWHNSTMICLMPFAIATYLMAVRQFELFEKARNLWMTLLVILGTLIKPSFFFIFAVAYPIMMLVRFKFSKEFWLSLIPIAVGVGCVLYEYFSIYIFHSLDNDYDSSVIVDVASLLSIDFWKDHALYLLVSMSFPCLFLIVYRNELFKDSEFWFVLIMLIVAVGIKLCCHETGPRESHGNMGWQTVPAMWFVYFYVLKKIIVLDLQCDGERSNLIKSRIRGRLFICLYGAHVCVGIIYLLKYLITMDYH